MTPKVLVVDDEAISRQISAKMVEAQGLDVETATNGQEALSQWQDKRYSLIITDCYMPTMDGFQLAESIRRIEATEHCKPTIIIALSANASKQEHERCKEAGMNDFITKPVTIAKLRSLIDSILTTDSTEHVEQGIHDHVNKNVVQPQVDFLILAEVFPDKNKQTKVLSDLQQHVKANFNELKFHINNTDLTYIESIAHRMKGACKMVGVNGIASTCAEIEQLAKNGVIANALTIEKLQQSIQAFDAYLDEQPEHLT